MAKEKIKELYFTGYIATRGRCNFSRIIEFNNRRFKLTCEVGNSYCRHKIYVMTADGAFAEVANEFDVKDLLIIGYLAEIEAKIEAMESNMDKLVKWVTSVYA